MFQKIWRVIFFLAFSPAAWAFEVDGIYYYILSSDNKTVAVTYKSFFGGDYSGDVTIPATVSYNGTVYSVTSIGWYAFEDCTGLTSVTIPEGVTTISEAAFEGCTGLEKFEGKFAADNGRCLIVNDTLKAFAPSGLTQYTIPDGVTTIDGYTFSDCSSLTSITIPNSVTAIGDRAFDDCTDLKAVYISDIAAWCKISFRVYVEYQYDGSYYIGTSNPLSYAHNLYLAGKPVTDVKIPEGFTSISEGAFWGCDSLKSITIPESVTFIGRGAFRDCTGLTNLRIEDGTKRLSLSTTDIALSTPFYNCPLDTVYLGRNIDYSYEQYNIRHDDDSPFRNKKSLVSLTIGSLVTEIGNEAFGGCTGLTSVTIPKSVTTIGEAAFEGCTGLEKFEGKFATDDHCSLIVNDTLFIAFAPKCGVAEYAIPNSVTSIGNRAFYDCDGLTSVTIPNSVTTIGEYAFWSCTSLMSVTIGSRVATIGGMAFSGCPNLQTITPLGTIPPTISYYTFDSYTYKNATVNYPKGSLHAYKTAPYWSNFTYNYPLPEKALNPQLICDSVGETKYHCTVSYTHDIEYPVSKLYISTGKKEYALDTALTTLPVTIIDLEPETEYDAQFIIETIYGDQIVTPVTFTTDTVHLTAQPAKTTDVKATLEAVVKCDAETGYGFEWRRYGAPDNLPPTRVEAYNIDGKIAGTLRNLTPEAYYEFRPYYRTVSGKYYYDEWVAFGTFDYGVEWDPTVSTRAGEVEGNNSTISAYVVEGSDELLSQGFEYWAESPAARSTESIATRSTASNPERIEGSGTLMSVTLTGLDYNTTYYYRAYATTAKKTTYGNTESFTTGKAPVVQDFKPSGINPDNGAEVTALKTITLEFEETPSLAVKAQTITLAGNDTLLTATLSAGSGNTLAITLADTLKVAGEYTLTIPEGAFGDADFADDPTVGHCNPELVYTYTIKEPEPVEPDEPENPDDPSAVTETQADAEHIAVYNLQGVLVLETDDAADLKTLQSGAYIVNGKKMIIVR